METTHNVCIRFLKGLTLGASTLQGRYAKRAFKNDYAERGTGIAYIHLNMEPEEPEIKLPTSVRSSKKQESSRKTPTSALLIMPKPLTVSVSQSVSSVAQSCPTLCDPMCGSQQTVENSSRGRNTRTPYLPPEKYVCRSRSNS